MKGDFSDRQRQRDEARRRASRSERTFRTRQDAGRISMLRESANINRLTGEIERSAEDVSASRSKQRADLYEEWDRIMKSARERIADCPGISQATRDRWSNDIQDLLVFSPGVKAKLEALKAEVTSSVPDATKEFSLESILETPRHQDLSLFSPKTARALHRHQEMEQDLEREEEQHRSQKKAGLVLVDLEIDRLIRLYDMYQYL